jgi:hypothetical protein
MFVSAINKNNISSETLASTVSIFGYTLFEIIQGWWDFCQIIRRRALPVVLFPRIRHYKLFFFEFFVSSRFLLLFSLYLGVSTGWIELRGYRPIES